MPRPTTIAIALTLCGCGATTPAPGLAPAALPAEAAGLIPGVSTEADVAKAWPTAAIARDRSFGGEGLIAYNGRPAIKIEVEPAEAPPPVAPARQATLVPNPGEHTRCAATPGGKRRLEISCYDGATIRFSVEFEHGTYGM